MLEAILLANLTTLPASQGYACHLKGKEWPQRPQGICREITLSRKLPEQSTCHLQAAFKPTCAAKIPRDVEASSLPRPPSPRATHTTCTPSPGPTRFATGASPPGAPPPSPGEPQHRCHEIQYPSWNQNWWDILNRILASIPMRSYV